MSLIQNQSTQYRIQGMLVLDLLGDGDYQRWDAEYTQAQGNMVPDYHYTIRLLI